MTCENYQADGSCPAVRTLPGNTISRLDSDKSKWIAKYVQQSGTDQCINPAAAAQIEGRIVVDGTKVVPCPVALALTHIKFDLSLASHYFQFIHNPDGAKAVQDIVINASSMVVT